MQVAYCIAHIDGRGTIAYGWVQVRVVLQRWGRGLGWRLETKRGKKHKKRTQRGTRSGQERQGRQWGGLEGDILLALGGRQEERR